MQALTTHKKILMADVQSDHWITGISLDIQQAKK